MTLLNPAGMKALGGTVAAEGSELPNDSATPPGGAFPFKYTVPVTGLADEVAFSLRAMKLSNGSTARVLVTVVLPEVAVIMGTKLEFTVVVVMGKVTLRAPAGINAPEGTAAMLGLSLVNVTAVPPTGAMVAKVTVPVVEAPPTNWRLARNSELLGAGGLNGAFPVIGNGRYNGSPTFTITHFNQRVFRRNASPTLAPSSKLRANPPGRVSPSR